MYKIYIYVHNIVIKIYILNSEQVNNNKKGKNIPKPECYGLLKLISFLLGLLKWAFVGDLNRIRLPPIESG